jgi:hypothetical protein
MSNYNINLQDYRTPGSKVFTGRDRGVEVRDRSKINTVVSQYDTITISIPEDIRSINPSFLEEFLIHVVSKLGELDFKKKFHFDNPGRYKIEDDLNEAIERILREENALA